MHDRDPWPPQRRIPAALDEGRFGFGLVESAGRQVGILPARWRQGSLGRTGTSRTVV